MTETIFEATEDEVDGGYSASALGFGIHTQGDSMEEIRRNVREAVDCYFDETMEGPGVIHFERPSPLGKPSASAPQMVRLRPEPPLVPHHCGG